MNVYENITGRNKNQLNCYNSDIENDCEDMKITFAQTPDGFKADSVQYTTVRLNPGTKISVEVAENGFIVKHKSSTKVCQGRYDVSNIIDALSYTRKDYDIPFNADDWDEESMNTIVNSALEMDNNAESGE